MPRHLTLTESVVSLLLYGAVGWWLGGWRGAAAGVALLLVLLSRAVWIAARGAEPQEGERNAPPGDSRREL